MQLHSIGECNAQRIEFLLQQINPIFAECKLSLVTAKCKHTDLQRFVYLFAFFHRFSLALFSTLAHTIQCHSHGSPPPHFSALTFPSISYTFSLSWQFNGIDAIATDWKAAKKYGDVHFEFLYVLFLACFSPYLSCSFAFSSFRIHLQQIGDGIVSLLCHTWYDAQSQASVASFLPASIQRTSRLTHSSNTSITWTGE